MSTIAVGFYSALTVLFLVFEFNQQQGVLAERSYAKLLLKFRFENPSSKMENGIWCHLFYRKGCNLRFEIKLIDAGNLESSSYLYSKTTGVYKDAKLVDFESTVSVGEPLPVTYYLNIKVENQLLTGHFGSVAEFAARGFSVEANTGIRHISMTRVKRNHKNEDAKISVQIKIECSANQRGKSCQTFCDQNAVNYRCNENGEKICKIGYTGEHCQNKIWCLLEPCTVGEICEEYPDGTGRRCNCDPNQDPSCPRNPCANSPCANGGECITSTDHPANFTCLCKPPWTGPLCERTQSMCSDDLDRLTNYSSKCLNGGKCIDDPEKNNFTCVCDKGWKGRFCEISEIVTDYFVAHTIFFNGILPVLGIISVIVVAVVFIFVIRRYNHSKKKNSWLKLGTNTYYHTSTGSTQSQPRFYVSRTLLARHREPNQAIYEECIENVYLPMSPRLSPEESTFDEDTEQEDPPALPERPSYIS